MAEKSAHFNNGLTACPLNCDSWYVICTKLFNQSIYYQWLIIIPDCKAQRGENYPIGNIANYCWQLLQGITFIKKNAKKMAQGHGFCRGRTDPVFEGLILA
jgi:hypothetical protein